MVRYVARRREQIALISKSRSSKFSRQLQKEKSPRAKKARELSMKSLCSCLAVFLVEQVNLKSPLSFAFKKESVEKNCWQINPATRRLSSAICPCDEFSKNIRRITS